jgi:hypothetical protein
MSELLRRAGEEEEELEDRLFDVHASTIPSFSLNKCLKKSFIGREAIRLVRNDGTNAEHSFECLFSIMTHGLRNLN